MTTVSIIIPCYNEQATIAKLLEAIFDQTYPRDEMEVVISDGMSTDSTRKQIDAFKSTHLGLRITVVDNPLRNIPAALNAAIAVASGEIILRLDAHSWPYPDYVERSVADLELGLGDNVGGVWEILPGAETWSARAVAAAAGHPLGVGDALYRHSTKGGDVDTIPFGAFKRELLALVGFFDETLMTNEDYEFNTRIRERGGKVWLDPAIRSVYFARSTFPDLARQYWRYGFWKYRMLRNYPNSLRWRQAIPPLFALSLLGLALLGFAWSGFWWVLTAEVLLYSLVMLAAGAYSAIKKKESFRFLGLPLAFFTMHLSYGLGFLWSIIKGLFHPKRAGR